MNYSLISKWKSYESNVRDLNAKEEEIPLSYGVGEGDDNLLQSGDPTCLVQTSHLLSNPNFSYFHPLIFYRDAEGRKVESSRGSPRHHRRL